MAVRRALLSDADLPPEWQASWWAQDYSWDGLHNKDWYAWFAEDNGPCSPAERQPSMRQASWQDYWRRGPGSGREGDSRTDEEIDRDLLESKELILGPAKEKWHLVHLPFRWPNGQRTQKAEWDDAQWAVLENIVANRLAAAADIETAYENASDMSDRRVMLGGAVLRTLDSGGATVSGIRADYAAILDVANFAKQEIGPNLNFDRTFFNAADFSGAHFLAGREEQFSSFDGAFFLRPPTFESAEFDLPTQFLGTIFKQNATFSTTVFRDVCNFSDTSFLGGAWFWKATFAKTAWFTNSVWGSGGSFEAVTFDGTPAFEGAQLHQDITFDGAKFVAVDATLRRAQLRLLKFFSYTLVGGFAAYGLAQFNDMGGWGGLFFKILKYVAILTSLWFALVTAGWSMFGGARSAESLAGKYDDDGDTNLERWVRAFRTLALLTDNVRNKRDSAKFHRLELRASRLRTGTTKREMLVSKPAERMLSAAYDLVSGYGESIVRPILFLFVAVAMFAGVFLYIGDGSSKAGAPVAPALIEAVSYSAGRVFPFGSWSDAETDNACSLRKRLFEVRTSAGILCLPSGEQAKAGSELYLRRLIVSALGIMESIASGVLTFLLALSIRRRFQI